MAEKKYYWLKLKRDFFKRHDIRIVEDMPNGKDYILFYMKLLVESVDHDGALRFSDTIPYNEHMLATITNTNIDIVRQAMNIFTELKMIEILDDNTIFISEVQKMIGSASDNDNARRQQRFRDRKKNAELPDSVTKSNADVTDSVTNNNESKSIEKEIDIEKELELDNISNAHQRKFIPPTVEEVEAYCEDRGNDVDAEKFVAFYSSKNWMIGKNKMTNWKQAVITWEKNRKPQQKTQQTPSNPFTQLLKEEGYQ